MTVRQVQLSLWGAAVVVLLAAYGGWRHTVQVQAVAAYAVKDDVTVIRKLTKSADSLLAIYRVDTVRLTKRIQATDTLLQHLIDTARIYRTDTVRVPVTVLVQADSTIHACKAVLSECEQGWTTEKARSATLQAETQRLRQLIPSPAATWLERALWGIGGYAVGRVVSGKALP